MTDRPLRPYQLNAITAVLDEWDTKRATLLVLATGLGKTRTAVEISRIRREHGRVLWLAHREELLDQAGEALRVDGGLSTDLERAESRAIVHGLFGGADCVVASVATLHKKRLQRWPANTFGTVVVDEAHHSTADGYRAILDHFASAKVLGLTATPDRGDGIALRNIFESCAFQYGILDGIKGGYLAPIKAKKIVVGSLDLSTVRTTAGDFQANDLERVMKVEGVIHQIAAPLVEEAGTRSTIAFLPTVAVAEELARVLAGYVGAERVACISANTPTDLRRSILAGYKSGAVQFVTNCAVLTEGFDAPSTACIAMARPTKSRALYTQCVGRGTRIAPGKDALLLLDFCASNRDPDLVGPTDVLAGKDLDGEAREAVERRLTTGGAAEELDDLIAEAREAAARIEAEKARDRKSARLRLVVPYARRDMELFPQYASLVETAEKTLRTGGTSATQKQREFLERYGIAVPNDTSAASASDVVTYVIKKNMPTIKQAKLLAKNNLRSDVTRGEAKEIIDQIAGAGWIVPQTVRAKWTAQKAA